MSARRSKRTSRVGEWATLDRGSLNVVRIVELEELQWFFPENTEIWDFIVASCPFGGPIALCRRNTNEVTVFTATGSIFAPAQNIGTSGKVKYMSWNETQDHLIIVCNDGQVYFTDSSLQLVASPVKIENPAIFVPLTNGLACITESCRAVTLECMIGGSGEYRSRAVDIPGIMDLPSSFAAISAEVSESGYDELLIAPTEMDLLKETTLFRAVFSSPPHCTDLHLNVKGGSIVKMALSPVNQNLILISADGTIHCSQSHYTDLEVVGTTETEEPPAQLLWCGERCAAFVHLNRQFDETYDSIITFVDPKNSANSNSEYFHNVPVDFYCAQEVDGFRVLSKDKHQFVQVVPESAYRAFMQPQKPAAKLLLAYDYYMEEDPAAVTILRQLTSDTSSPSADLIQAIEDCIEIAGFEFDVEGQQRLLRIAAHGKCFSRAFETDTFVDMCRRLRALNAVCNPVVGMVMSMVQFKTLEGEHLASRLVQQGHYQLAFHICKYLGLPPDNVLLQWARKKIVSTAPDNEIAESIIAKLSQVKGLSFSSVAEAAHHNHKQELAVKLLEAEPYAENQVPVLLRMGHEEIALTKGIESGNSDLVFVVMTHLIAQRAGAASSFIMRNPVSRDMLLLYCLSCDSQRHLLSQYYKDHPQYECHLALLQYLREEERLKRNHIESKKVDGWDMVQEFKISAAQTAEFAVAKDPEEGKGAAKLLKLQQLLLEEQSGFARATKKLEFLNASVGKTIRLLFQLNMGDKAEGLRTKFGVTDKMFSWCKLRGLVAAGDWDAIDKMGGGGVFRSAKVKSPIGFQPFVMECFNAGQAERAAGFIHRIADLVDRLELYVMCEDWEGATRDILQNKEYEMLEQLKDRARGHGNAPEMIDRAQRQLKR